MKAIFVKHRIIFWLCTIFLASLLTSCDHSYLEIEEIEDYHYNAEFAVPAVNTILTIDDFYKIEEEPTARVDDDNMIELIYKGRVISLEASEVFSIDDQSSVFMYEYAPPSKSNAKSVVEETFTFVYAGEERIDKIKFMSGSFVIDIDAPQLLADGYDLNIDITVPNSSDDNDQEFNEEILLSDTPETLDLSGYTFIFDTDGDNTNFFEIEYVISIAVAGTPDNSPYTLQVEQEIIDIEFEELVGYIDNFDFLVGSDELDVRIFSNSVLSTIFFKNPHIDVFSENSFGLPLDIHFDEFYFNNDEGDVMNLSGSGFEERNPWRVEIPTEMGQSVSDQFRLDRNNLNIDDIIEISPVRGYYEVTGETNPEGEIPGTPNFVRHDSQFNVDVELYLPMYGNSQQYVFKDTLEFSGDKIMEESEEGEEYLEWIELKLNINNGFPFNLSIQGYFVDENYEELETLFDEDYVRIIESASVDSNGDVTETTLKETLIFMDYDRIQNITDANKVIIELRPTTKPGEPDEDGDPFSVKVYDYYEIDFKMGVKAKFDYTREIDYSHDYSF